MRNYVIINGVNSTTIQGLAINILPPITKPLIRTQIEEIDGRDGDLVTELGYSAYDKSMEIGLWGTYDIDAIIKYFTGEGKIVFSNEPDKFYNFKIINQIDYDKLLKFKKATVTFHCQPYKYPTSETPLEEQYEYVEDTGTDITLDNTEETIFNKFDLIGNTYQYSTTGKNFLNINNIVSAVIQVANDTLTLTSNAGYNPTDTGYNLSTVCPTLVAGQTYTLSFNTTETSNSNRNNMYLRGSGTFWQKGTTHTITQEELNDRIAFYGTNSVISELMISTNGGDYEKYTGGIPAPNPSYPEQVHVISGDNSIEVVGKNLFDDSVFSTNPNVSVDSNGFYTGTLLNINAYFNSNFKNYAYKENTQYTITYTSYGSNTSSNGRFVVSYTDGTTQNWNITATASATNIIYRSTSGKTISNITMTYGSGGTMYIKNIMLVEGNYDLQTMPPYEPYQGSSYPISLGVKNEINESLYTTTGSAYVDSIIGGVVTSTSMTGYQGMRLDLGQDIVLPANTNVYIRFKLKSSAAGNVFNMVQVMDSTNASKVTTSITKPNPTTEYQGYYCSYNQSESFTLRRLYFQHVGSSSETFTVKDIMLSFTPSINYYPYSNVPIEMCSIPNTDYKDTFLHEDNKWYKYAMVGKVSLDGTQGTVTTPSTNRFNIDNAITDYKRTTSDNLIYLSNQYKAYKQTGDNASFNTLVANESYGFNMTSSELNSNIRIKDTRYTTTTDFKNWLSSNTLTMYYVLANPTQTEITDETLKAQLDDLWENATSYKGQTNITQTNNDLPFILDVSALKDGSDHLIIDNIGTAYSKPTIDIEGTGIVDIYLNDEQIFEIDMTTQNEIIIDTEKMEAYTPDNLLANRLVTGDYSNFKLAPGENDLRFSGDLTKATVTRYIRWI